MLGLPANEAMTSGLLVVLMIALLTDLHDRRIPNTLICIGLAVGLVGHAVFFGIAGFALAIAGALTGLLCLLPFYLSGGMGAGDVKLMGVCGAFLGPLHVLVATAATLTIGGLIGVVWLFWQVAFMARDRNAGGADGSPTSSVGSAGMEPCAPVPYALAIAAGAVTALLLAPAVARTLAGGIL